MALFITSINVFFFKDIFTNIFIIISEEFFSCFLSYSIYQVQGYNRIKQKFR